MTIIASESVEDGFFLGWAENDETGRKAVAESNQEGRAMELAIKSVKYSALPRNLTAIQDITRKTMNIRYCKSCEGSDCDWCGGVGAIKKCDLTDCHEYGCCGRGVCDVSKGDIERIMKSDIRGR